ncbi:zinc transporter ZIP4-like [Ylistrum balloti]|uniref:zinc transporter ZIP4-like n=1 Tax=Ylistrum balloti TaxID=509963 RepID=UPI002905F524|nr:zinc transporter ZIP4-like [Ylistrum balloti]
MAATILTVAINFECFVGHALPSNDLTAADFLLEYNLEHNLKMLNLHYIRHRNGDKMERMSYTNRLQCLNVRKILEGIQKELKIHGHDHDVHQSGSHTHINGPPPHHSKPHGKKAKTDQQINSPPIHIFQSYKPNHPYQPKRETNVFENNVDNRKETQYDYTAERINKTAHVYDTEAKRKKISKFSTINSRKTPNSDSKSPGIGRHVTKFLEKGNVLHDNVQPHSEHTPSAKNNSSLNVNYPHNSDANKNSLASTHSLHKHNQAHHKDHGLLQSLNVTTPRTSIVHHTPHNRPPNHHQAHNHLHPSSVIQTTTSIDTSRTTYHSTRTQHLTPTVRPPQTHQPRPDELLQLDHRLKCLNIDGKRLNSRRLYTTQRQQIENSFATIAMAIIQGYRLQDNDLPCPVEFLRDIFDRYAEKGKLHSSGVKRLMSAKKPHALHERDHSTHNHDYHSIYVHAHDHSPQINITCDIKKRRTMEAYDRFVNLEGSTSKVMPCLRKSDIRTLFHHKEDITMNAFLDMCPVILHQLVSGACLNESSVQQQQQPTTTEKYGLGTLCVFIISLCSFAGAVFVKCAHNINRMYVMAGLIALSVGCLLGDAIIHLLPHVLEEGHHSGHSESHGDSLYKMCGALASVYCFFLLELFFSHSHSPKKAPDMNIEISRDTQSCNSATSDIQLINLTKNNLRTENKNRLWQKVSTNSADAQQEEESKSQSSGSLKWMVLIGEAVHNFADGMAIGASFADSLTEGLSTSLAVFCHELPHELGDFAVLLSTGMSIRKALMLNFVSSLTAFIGLYIGLTIGSNDEARLWTLSFGAGMFVYVALTTLMPELVDYFNCYTNFKMFLSLNIGLLLGFVLMLLLAIFENDIRLML